MVGLFDEEMRLGQDLDYFLRMREVGIPMAIHDNLIQVYNKHGTNSTNDRLKAKLFMLRAIKKARERRENNTMPGSDIALNNVGDAIKRWHTAELKK